ncbi:helix-turn-helix domain-containing protein [Streptococcus mitis]|jgi:repressor|uniref:helix-turn-helix domain-containing protein n=1 Tax=Streptococcus mitis TaxID=28037 RepID=UPI0020011A10|nr:helix-turn-helix transcriptional regulator [Streptococcus mitis]DAJ22652.1 MAG TPA: repressor protein [Siphoviridae sp. ct5pn1]DAS43758.1 MAG TPA: repressor protein [Caudoviricetes sp.]
MLYDKIKEVAKTKSLSIYRIERDLGFSNGSLRKWNNSTPSATSLKKVANYLNVTSDELLEETT